MRALSRICFRSTPESKVSVSAGSAGDPFPGPGRSGAKPRPSEGLGRRSGCNYSRLQPPTAHPRHSRRSSPPASPPARPPSARLHGHLGWRAPCRPARPGRAVGANLTPGAASCALAGSPAPATGTPRRRARPSAGQRARAPSGGASWRARPRDAKRGRDSPAAGTPESVIAPSQACQDRGRRRAGRECVGHQCAHVKGTRTAARRGPAAHPDSGVSTRRKLPGSSASEAYVIGILVSGRAPGLWKPLPERYRIT